MVRAKERGPVRIEWLQVPDDMVLVRSENLAALLTKALGRRVSHGDALLHVIKVWMWVVAQVNEDNPDVAEEFARSSVIERSKAEMVLAHHLKLPAKHGADLVDCLLDPSVRVLEPVPLLGGDGVRVREVEERYTALAKKQGESRGRARVSRMARDAGWVAAKGGRWEHPVSGASVDDWRALEARLKGVAP